MGTDERQHVSAQRRRHRPAPLCVLVFTATWVTIAPFDALAETDGIPVSLKTVSLDVVQGRLIRLSLEDGILIEGAGSDKQHIPFEDLVRLETDVAPSVQPQQDYTLEFANGDVVHGDIVEGDGDTVVIETPDLGRLKVPLESVTRMAAAVASRSAHRDSVRWFDQRGSLDEDSVLLTNGDVLQGFVDSVDAIGIVVESGLGGTLVPHRLVVAVRLASPHIAQPDSPHLLMTLQNGCRLTLTDLNWAGNVAEALHVSGQRLLFNAGQVVKVEFVGGRWEWLSARRPISYEHTPLLSLGWEYALNRNVLGGPIEVDGQKFDHGVGVHSRSRLIYDLEGGYDEFVTSFGIDDNSGPHADVAISILVDGQRRFAQQHVRRGKLHGPIRIDTKRAKRIELLVDFGDNGNLQDRFNWVEAALVR